MILIEIKSDGSLNSLKSKVVTFQKFANMIFILPSAAPIVVKKKGRHSEIQKKPENVFEDSCFSGANFWSAINEDG